MILTFYLHTEMPVDQTRNIGVRDTASLETLVYTVGFKSLAYM